jgi:predicted NUDIX family NTP pyrophosphohydrolase
MAKQSAGILLYRAAGDGFEVFLVHPGGPFFRNRDLGWWTVPKGEPMPGEGLLETARREFEEETGYRPEGRFIALQSVVQKGGKTVQCWAVSGDLDPMSIICNTFELEWPPKSGKIKAFPEVDQARWFTLTEAEKYINERQLALLNELAEILGKQVEEGKRF